MGCYWGRVGAVHTTREAQSPKEEGRMNPHALAFWSLSATEMLQQLHASPEGLTGAEARQRLTRYGANLLKPRKRSDALTLLLAQFKSPIILILL